MKSFFNKLQLILTIQCARAAELTSESLERPLELHERAALRGHILGCWSCRQFEKQIQFLHTAFAQMKRDEIASLAQGEQLDEAFKQRLKQLTRDDLSD